MKPALEKGPVLGSAALRARGFLGGNPGTAWGTQGNQGIPATGSLPGIRK